MCGFLAKISKSKYHQNLLSKNKFECAAKEISHRGPDFNSTIHLDNGTSFAHYRLSIIDNTNNSDQPFVSKCGRYILIFNGEIYNYKYLANKYFPGFLIKGDTETLMLLLINHHMNKFLSEIEGMFSFVFFDKVTNNFLAARDRFGIKPLYYFDDKNTIIFASEPFPIAKIINAKSDIVSLHEIESYRRPSPGFSYYENVLECIPGFYITNNKIGRWKNSQRHFYKDTYSLDELIDRLKYVFNLNTIADNPHTAFQSGGMDSSLISYLTRPCSLYTVGMNDNNEIGISRKIASILNLEIKTQIVQKEEFLILLTEYLKIKKEPISVPNEILIFKLCKTMNPLHKYFLTGEGSDEIFFGYDRIFKWANTFGKEISNITFLELFLDKYSYSYKAHKGERFINYCTSLFENCESHLDFIEDFFLDFHLPGLLNRADRASMAAGKEARVPFCSQTIVDYMYRRPFEIKINNNKAKYPLHQILDKTKISFILSTPKIGFSTLIPGMDNKGTYNYMLKFFNKLNIF